MIFDAIRGWSERRTVLRDLAKQQRLEQDRDVMRFTILLERAEAAMAADQRSQAIKVWHEIRDRFYSRASASERLLKILLDLRLFDDAEQLMSAGFKRYPKQQFYIVGRARVAQLAGDIPLALARWAIVRQKFPEFTQGYAQSAACLAAANRLSDAEKMLSLGIKKRYDDVFCLIEHAKVAEAQGNLEAALLRWQHLRDVQPNPAHPSYQNGTIGLAKCLRIMGRFDEAEALMRPFIDQFGVQEVPLMEIARIAEDRGDADEAIKRWERVTRVYPQRGEGYLSLIRLLKMRGETSKVETVLSQATDRLPDELWPAREYAEMANSRGDNEEAARRWLMVIEQFPDCETAFRNAADALTALGRTEAAATIRAERASRATA